MNLTRLLNSALLFLLLQLGIASTEPSLAQYGQPQALLGEGAGGAVYLYQRPNDSKAFAVKEFTKEGWDGVEEESIWQVKEEFNIAKALDHPSFIETFDLLQANGSWYLVMRYHADNLYNRAMREASIARLHAMCIFRQLVDGVSFMHAQGFAHLDLKLSNVMLDVDGNAKIIDFGTSYRFRQFGGEIEQRWGMLFSNAEGFEVANDGAGLVGALPFLPPEVYETPKYDPQPVDIWALAMIFCQMNLPLIPWKGVKVPCDILDDHFGLFSWSAVREAQGRSAASLPQRCPTTTRKDDAETIRKTMKSMIELLPPESQHLVGRMLEPLPQARANWSEILADPMLSRMECPR